MIIESSIDNHIKHLWVEEPWPAVGSEALYVLRNRVQMRVMERLRRFKEGMTEAESERVFLAWEQSGDALRFAERFAEYYYDEARQRIRDADALAGLIVAAFDG